MFSVSAVHQAARGFACLLSSIAVYCTSLFTAHRLVSFFFLQQVGGTRQGVTLSSTSPRSFLLRANQVQEETASGFHEKAGMFTEGAAVFLDGAQQIHWDEFLINWFNPRLK